MKKIFSIFTAVLVTATVWAQSPQKMSYQAVIRNSSDVLVTNTQIGMEINIRQGTITGTIIYTETQTPTTNANGLVSIEIGGGTGFNTIDWANGPYFIETKTAIVPPLTTYTITGTSQLLSVPYALHAKTAETVTGGINETDPIFTAWNKDYNSLTNKPTLFDGQYSSLTGTPALATVATSGSYNDLSNKPTIPAAADGSETKVTAGPNVTVTGAGTIASPYVVNATGATVFTIGQAYQGGIIFWLDATGQHGLIAATADQSAGIQWCNGIDRYTGTTGDGLYAGSMNTAMIVATQMADNQTGNFAAKVCADYSVTVGDVTYGDWYLPSKYELNLLYQQKLVVGGFTNNMYWSSTEYGPNNSACYHMFDSGFQSDGNRKYAGGKVRAIRAF